MQPADRLHALDAVRAYALLFGVVLLGLAAVAGAQTAAVFPGTDWQRVAPKEAGFSAARLDALRSWLKTQRTTGLVVVADGRVVLPFLNVVIAHQVAFDDEAERGGQPVTELVQPWEYDAIVSMIIAANTG